MDQTQGAAWTPEFDQTLRAWLSGEAPPAASTARPQIASPALPPPPVLPMPLGTNAMPAAPPMAAPGGTPMPPMAGLPPPPPTDVQQVQGAMAQARQQFLPMQAAFRQRMGR